MKKVMSKINWELTRRITSTKTKSEGKTMLNVDEGNYWTLIQLDNQTRKYVSKKKNRRQSKLNGEM